MQGRRHGDGRKGLEYRRMVGHDEGRRGGQSFLYHRGGEAEVAHSEYAGAFRPVSLIHSLNGQEDAVCIGPDMRSL